MNEPSAFGELLRRSRRTASMTQEALAERSGVSVRAITEIERGIVRAPQRDTLEMLADALELEYVERRRWREVRQQLSVRRASRASKTKPASTVLPASPNALLGRETELYDVTEAVMNAYGRLVTITGPGGVGKTRLALEAATKLQDEFADGVVFVELATIREQDLVLTTIATQIGLHEAQQQDVRERLATFLSQREILLLLDNFEHLVSAAPDIADLLAIETQSRFLVTSRAALRIKAEYEFPLMTLQQPDWGDRVPIDEMDQYASVRLFIERARQADPAFELTTENAGEIQHICAHLDGLPLAIELAAARVKMLTPHAILAHLAHRLAFLSGGFRDSPDRHRTMRGAIAWSYELLEQDERVFFSWLATFAGGWSLEAAARINPVDLDVLSGLEALLDNNLIIRTEDPHGSTRYSMLETIRELGLEQRDDSGNLEPARDAHAGYFVELAETSEPHLRGPEQMRWLDIIEVELPNIRSALDWSIWHRPEDEIGLRLAGSLAWFWFTRGYISEGRNWLSRALTGSTASSPARMKALAGAGWLAHLQQDADAAREFLEQSLSLSRDLEDDWYSAWSLHLLGRVAYFADDAETAQKLASESLELAQRSGDDWLIAWPHHLLGLAAHIAGDADLARTHYETSLRIRQEINDQGGIATLVSLLGLLYYKEGDFTSAIGHFHHGLKLYRPLAGQWFIVNLVANVAAAAARMGETTRAATLSGYVDTLQRLIGAEPIPMTSQVYSQGLEIIREALTADEIEIAWTAGSRLTLDEAVEEALLVGRGIPDGR